MPADQLNLTLIQPDIVWEDKEANFRQYEQLIADAPGKKEVVILPEMFSTGFSMAPERLAEPMDGPSVRWMKEQSARQRCILAGSLIIEEGGAYYNRMIWMQPDGRMGVYDKKHLFAYAGEDQHYAAGNKRLIASVKGWRIQLLICYDLRFPVWARQAPQGGDGDEYDVLVYVANWPERRALAWNTLLQARAIENQCFVVGVNRVGVDGKGISYTGDSRVFGPLGQALAHLAATAGAHTLTLDKQELVQTRAELPFLKDADKFLLL